jgi:hypothetical protein
MWTRGCLSIRIASTNATTATVLFLLGKYGRRQGNILGCHHRKSTTTTTKTSVAVAVPLSISPIIPLLLARLYQRAFPSVRNSKIQSTRARATEREREEEQKQLVSRVRIVSSYFLHSFLSLSLLLMYYQSISVFFFFSFSLSLSWILSVLPLALISKTTSLVNCFLYITC